MPWNISNADGFFCIVFSGTVSDRDLVEIADAVEALETGSNFAPHRISNLSAAEGMNLTFQSIMTLVQRRKKVPLSNRIKSAIIAPEPLQFGFARMFHTLNDHPMITVQIFRNECDAVAWIQKI